MIEIAKEARIEQLKEIWRKCFDDPDEYIDFFMENAFNLSVPVVCVKDNVAVGVIYLFACEIGRTGKKAYYWYAGGVLPQYRKRGVFREIAEYILKFAGDEGALSFLYAMPGLRDFYKKSGLEETYYSFDIELETGNTKIKSGITRGELTAEEYIKLRDDAFGNKNFVRWDEPYLEYVLKEKKFCGGICDRLKMDEEVYALAGEIRDDILYIEETTMDYDKLTSLAEDLSVLYRVSKIHAHIPGYMIGKNADKPEIISGVGNVNSDELWISLTLL